MFKAKEPSTILQVYLLFLVSASSYKCDKVPLHHGMEDLREGHAGSFWKQQKLKLTERKGEKTGLWTVIALDCTDICLIPDLVL